ncbi:MAG: aryl sulfotransferase [Acidimicrobiaceae bacterium]|jgi:hypothetical protein|nr:aryl sulfotransferase [Acidimicrobiaceae bacterium]
MSTLPRYRSFVMDSARWEGFPFRAGDIVISTPPKCGTTWTQMLCALLVFDSVAFDRPLAEISPWLDMQTTDLATVLETLEAQQHRRFIKTHTPLDALPRDDRVTYLCVGRDPRDVSLSWDHHIANVDLDTLVAVRAAAVGLDDLAELGPPPVPPPEDPLERFRLWVDEDAVTFPAASLASILQHFRTFWERREDPSLALFHYGDLQTDLAGQLRRLAGVLAIEVDADRVERFAAAATFAQMKGRANELVPDVRHRFWRSNEDFFHRGANGQWREILDDDALRRYDERVAALVPADLAHWAHHGWLGAADGDMTDGHRG